MTDTELLTQVKSALGITGDYNDETLTVYISEVKNYLIGAGIKPGNITAGIISRGVSDLWNYGAGGGKLSEYFMQRATQLSFMQ